jgi:hypothetical protein
MPSTGLAASEWLESGSCIRTKDLCESNILKVFWAIRTPSRRLFQTDRMIVRPIGADAPPDGDREVTIAKNTQAVFAPRLE